MQPFVGYNLRLPSTIMGTVLLFIVFFFEKRMYKDVIITMDNPRLEIASAHDIYKYIICDVQAIFNGGNR